MHRVAVAALFLTLLSAPLAGGGFRIDALWLLHGLAALAVVTASAASRARADAPLLTIALLLLAGFTAVQFLPLPGWVVEAVSPRAAEVWRLSGQVEPFSLSYEPAASRRETSKLILYAVVAMMAAWATERDRSFRPVALPLAVAGVASAGVALVHRLLGIERFFGLIPPMAGRADRVLTTFVNPNHGAAFLVLAAFAAAGLGLEARNRASRAGFWGMGFFCVVVSVLLLSKSGLLALAVSTLALAAAGAGRAWGRGKVVPGLFGAAVIAGSLLLTASLLRPNVAASELFGGGADVLGLSAKLAAVRDVGPMVADHPIAGIGRGAFVSVYPGYQSSPLQLTFYFPESLPAQFVSEWGALVGSLALAGLLALAIARLSSAEGPLHAALAAGVVGVLVHELFDFSLEMPGVALFVVAGLAPGPSSAGRARVRRSLLGLGSLVLLVVSALCLREAGRSALEADLARLDHAVEEGAASSIEPLEETARRHPASALVATRLAFVAEQSHSPDLRAAIRHANRALFLAPRYADPHLLTGRLLLRAGHRRQAFESFRQAWSLSSARRTEYLDYLVRRARSPTELLVAVPRTDPVTDRLDGRELARLVNWLSSRGRGEWAREVLEAAPHRADLSGDELAQLARSAATVGTSSVARSLLEAHARRRPDDPGGWVLLVRYLVRTADFVSARAILDEAPDESDPELAELGVRIAVAEGRWGSARAALARIRAARHVGVERIARLAAEVEIRAGQPEEAVRILDEALDRRPGALTLRVLRAEALIRLDRLAAARLDVAYILQRDPIHPKARRLRARLSQSSSVR